MGGWVSDIPVPITPPPIAATPPPHLSRIRPNNAPPPRPQVLEEIKTEEEVKRVCSGFGEANASDYGPTPQDSSNVYGPGAGLAAAAANGAGGAATAGAGMSGGSAPSWATAKAVAKAPGAEGGGGRGAAGANAAEIVAQISAQVIFLSCWWCLAGFALFFFFQLCCCCCYGCFSQRGRLG